MCLEKELVVFNITFNCLFYLLENVSVFFWFWMIVNKNNSSHGLSLRLMSSEIVQ